MAWPSTTHGVSTAEDASSAPVRSTTTALTRRVEPTSIADAVDLMALIAPSVSIALVLLDGFGRVGRRWLGDHRRDVGAERQRTGRVGDHQGVAAR